MTLLDRRQFLGCSLGSALGLWLSGPRSLLAAPPQASSCVILYLSGGPSQLDTFDPKPGTPNGGFTRAIKTSVPELRFAAHLPELAERADKLAVIRSLSSREGDHTRASYLLHTGYRPAPALKHPTLGSILSAEFPATDAVPSFVSLGEEQVGPGFRGAAHGAFVAEGRHGLLEPAVSRQRRQERLRLLDRLQEPGREGDERLRAYREADRLLEGPLRGALQVEGEPERVRQRYGEGTYGRRVLTARRLLEAGVRCVEVELGGWDDHQAIFTQLPARCRELDRAFSALLDDLQERDRLDSTLVICLGEFGRTPTINENEGRDHFPFAFSGVLAGGGVRPGVVGATSADGTEVVDQVVSVPDLFATCFTLLGLDPQATRYAGERPLTLADKGQPITRLI